MITAAEPRAGREGTRATRVRASIDLWLPCLEPAIGEWYSTSVAAQEGMPPHCSILYPWRSEPVTDSDIERLIAAASARGPIPVRIDRTGRFPGVLYLRPDSGGKLEALLRAVWDAFPESPPYAGALGADPDPVPHITVSKGPDDQLDEAERVLQPRLAASPIALVVRELTISEFGSDGRWCARTRISL